MKTVNVKASREYNVCIERGILKNSGEMISSVHKPCKAMLISDTNVAPLYAKTVTDSLCACGFEVVSFIIEAGEESKNAVNLALIWEALAENSLTRSDIIVALGGGVVGDLSGFAAATYLRGIEYIQIPTTLLAMVDSSVGGKTAVDLKAGKNLAGAFYQPSLVICDPDALNTLSPQIYSDGMAEVIKYGFINRPGLLSLLESDFDIADVIEICVEDKRDIVSLDEKDHGLRQLLNLGHTVGHGIERCSGYSITHGSAVAAGMAIITRAAINAGICKNDVLEVLIKLLEKFNLPTSCEFTAQEICNAAFNDKKRKGNRITLVIPEELGKSVLAAYDVDKLLDFISGAWKND